MSNCSLVSCLLFVYGTLWGVTLAEDTRRIAHTVSRPPVALVQRRSRALRPYPSRILWARVVRACHSFLARHPPFEFPNGDSTSEQVVKGMQLLSLRLETRPPTARSQAKFSLRASTLMPFWRVRNSPEQLNLCIEGLENLLEKSSQPISSDWFCGTAHLLGVWGKETKNCTCNQHAPTQDVVTSMSGLAMKRAAERPPVTAKGKGVPQQKKTVPRVGALCWFSGRCPFFSLCTFLLGVPMSSGSNVLVLRLGVPMSRRGRLVVLL